MQASMHKTQKECREWVRKSLNQIDAGLNFTNTKITIEDFMTDWLIGIGSSVRSTTLTQYKHISRDYIFPAIGNIKVKNLRPDQIQKLYKRKFENFKAIPNNSKQNYLY